MSILALQRDCITRLTAERDAWEAAYDGLREAIRHERGRHLGTLNWVLNEMCKREPSRAKKGESEA